MMWKWGSLFIKLFLDVTVHGKEDEEVILLAADDAGPFLVVELAQVVHIDCLIMIQLVQQGRKNAEASTFYTPKSENQKTTN